MARWPDNLRPSSIDWWLETNTLAHTSPLSKTTQTIEFPGARWRVSMSFQKLRRAELDRLSGFVTGLGGQAGRVTIPVFQQSDVPPWVSFPRYYKPSRSGWPIISNKEASYGDFIIAQGDKSIIVYWGYTLSTDEIIAPAGFYFMLGGELKKLTENTSRLTREYNNNKPSNYRTDWHFAPAVRNQMEGTWSEQKSTFNPYKKPEATFRLIDDNQGRASYRAGGQVGDMTLEFVEVF